MQELELSGWEHSAHANEQGEMLNVLSLEWLVVADRLCGRTLTTQP